LGSEANSGSLRASRQLFANRRPRSRRVQQAAPRRELVQRLAAKLLLSRPHSVLPWWSRSAAQSAGWIVWRDWLSAGVAVIRLPQAGRRL